MLATFDADHGFVADIAFGVGKLPGKLIVQIGAVGNQHNRRAGKLDAPHQQPRQEQHGVAFAAAGGPEVGAPFAVAVGPHVLHNVAIQHGRCVVLGVAAENFLLLPRGVGQVDEVSDHVEQAGGDETAP